jgi:hypothetical protein
MQVIKRSKNGRVKNEKARKIMEKRVKFIILSKKNGTHSWEDVAPQRLYAAAKVFSVEYALLMMIDDRRIAMRRSTEFTM